MRAIAVSQVSKSFGGAQILNEIDFAVEQGEFVTLLGPSGCGKTTTLRCIAGLEAPDAGEIEIAGKPAFSSTAGVNLRPEQRRLGMVFQSYAIWPHMTVAQNVAYGLRAMKVPPADVPPRVERALDMVGLPGIGARNATELSGGQQQRVALARSLVLEPEVLLLDEPLSNLDAKLRERMRFELKELQRRLGLTMVYVTHDQSEALALSDRIVIMDRGRIVQQGTSEEIYQEPQTRFVIDVIGNATFIEGKLLSYDAQTRAATVLAREQTLHGRVPIGCPQAPAIGEPATVALRAEDLRVSTSDPAGVNVLHGLVASQLFLGGMREVLIDVGVDRIKVNVPGELPLSDGQGVWLTIAPHALKVLV